MTALQIGRDGVGGPTYLNVWYQTLDLGRGNIEFAGLDSKLPPIGAPESNGSSGVIHVPAAAMVTAIDSGDESLTITYRHIQNPEDLKFGPEQEALWTVTPHSEGGGQMAHAPGCALTGFELIKDPDKSVHLKLWFRALL
ncbi:hypothetical protein [Bradyrhizobium sp. 169]|uniref:hypothetical protein n=1 Tax=Bradyrhizobium sp. 169 TaxID=2782640 RepID=UPI001FFA1583|nr:hypothetical protein [Bradyrhizobium sp. 169]MCK1586919.1 hypothetical protein [Bradyrhizobium sp. 169]